MISTTEAGTVRERRLLIKALTLQVPKLVIVDATQLYRRPPDPEPAVP